MARTTRKVRRGRGRLSRLDMLPEVAKPDLVWLNHQLRANDRPQTELFDLFNMRLAAHGIEPISSSSFSRYSVRKSTQFHELDDTMRMSRELAELLQADSTDKLTITLSNMLQTAAVRMVEAEGSNLAAKDLMELGRAVQSVTSAMKQSADYRRTMEDEHRRKLAETLDQVEKAAAKEPMDAPAVLAMIRKAYGWTE